MHRQSKMRTGVITVTWLIMLALLAACSNAPVNQDTTSQEPAAPTAVDEALADEAPVDDPTVGEPTVGEPAVGEPAPQEENPTEGNQANESADAATEADSAALPTVIPDSDTTNSESSAPDTTSNSAPTFDPAQSSVVLQPAYEGFTQPLFVTHADDGSNRLFVVEKGGRIQVIPDGATSPSLFLDITDRVGSSGYEQGLLGLAFPPNFSEIGHFFVNYTNANGNTIIARFQLLGDNPDQGDPASEFQIMQLDQPAPNHNGGMLAFGPDGYLWIGTGDGGAANNIFGNAMNPQSLLGKMLRIDVTSNPDEPYTIPSDNPWVEADLDGEDVMDEIWAIGIRNPWRYSFDRATGDLWMGDVGQNQYEEINWTPAGSPGGLNYGWSVLEGAHCFESADCDPSDYVLPVIEYSHGPHCSVTGGYVYRGSEFPALNGVYIYGDYCSGMMWTGIPHDDRTVTVNPAQSTGLTLSSFGESEDGEVYATDLTGGVVYQVVLE